MIFDRRPKIMPEYFAVPFEIIHDHAVGAAFVFTELTC
jgi:hypothetical protein